MIVRRLCRAIALALVVSFLCAWAPARAGIADSSATPLAVALGPGSVLWLEGTSTVHDFECRSTEVKIVLTGDPAGKPPADAAGLAGLIHSSAVRGVVVQVPVLSLRSGKAALDKNLRRAMRADEHPIVRFQLVKYDVKPGAAPEDTIGIQAEGILTVAGRECVVTLEARAHRAAEGVWLEGSETLLMSDYGIRPPKMMLGTLRVGDRITVRYRLLLVPLGQDTGSFPVPSR